MSLFHRFTRLLTKMKPLLSWLLIASICVSVLFLPGPAKAFDWSDALIGGAGGGALVGAGTLLACGLLSLGLCWAATGIIGGAAALIAGAWAGFGDLFPDLLGFFVWLITFAATWIIGFALQLVGSMLSFALWLNTQPILDPGDEVSQVILSATAITKSISNLLLIGVLIVIALATIANIQSYNVRHLLPLLVGMILIVNFSTVLVGLFIDAGNATMRYFWESSNLKDIELHEYITRNMELSRTFLANTDTFISQLSTPGDGSSAQPAKKSSEQEKLAYAAINLVLLFLGLFVTYIFLRFVMLLFMRVGVFWILIMTAPIVFILGVIPAGKAYVKDWWKQLVNWAFLGPILFFFIFFGLMIWATANQQLRNPDSDTEYAIRITVVFFIVMLFFAYALSISRRMAGAAANAVVDSVIGLGKAIALGTIAIGAGAALAGVGGYLMKKPFMGKVVEELKKAGFRRTAARLEQGRKGAQGKTEKEIIETSSVYEDYAASAGDAELETEYGKAARLGVKQRLAFINAMLKANRNLSLSMQEDALTYGKVFAPNIAQQVKEFYPNKDASIFKEDGGLNYQALLYKFQQAKQPQNIRFEGFTDEDQKRQAFMLFLSTLDASDLHRIASDARGAFQRFSDQLQQIGTLKTEQTGQYETLLGQLESASGIKKERLTQIFDEITKWQHDAFQRRLAMPFTRQTPGQTPPPSSPPPSP